MRHFINIKDIPVKDLRKIIADAKKRKSLRKKLSVLEVDKGAPLKGKILIQMFEKASSKSRFYYFDRKVISTNMKYFKQILSSSK